MSPPCESYLVRRPARPGRDLLPAARAGLHRVPAGAAARVHPGRGHLQPTTPTSRRTATRGCAHAEKFVDDAVARLGLGRRLVRRRGGQQRRLPAPARRRARHPLPGHRAGRQRRRGRASRRASRPRSMFLGEETGAKVAADARPGRPRRRQQRLRPRARHRRLRQGPAGPGRRRRARSRIEIPHLLRLIEGNEYDTIYHEHFSYLSLLTTQRVLAAAGLTVVDVEELPTHGGSLRTWSMPTEQRRRAHARGRARAGRRGGCRPAHASRATPASPRRWPTVRNDLARVPHRRARARARRWWPTARPGKGNTLLNHCGIRADLVAFSGRPQPVQARQVPAGHAHPDPPGRGARRGAARLRADHAVEPPRARSPPSWSYVAGLGRPPRRRAAASSRSSEIDAQEGRR